MSTDFFMFHFKCVLDHNLCFPSICRRVFNQDIYFGYIQNGRRICTMLCYKISLCLITLVKWIVNEYVCVCTFLVVVLSIIYIFMFDLNLCLYLLILVFCVTVWCNTFYIVSRVTPFWIPNLKLQNLYSCKHIISTYDTITSQCILLLMWIKLKRALIYNSHVDEYKIHIFSISNQKSLHWFTD